MHDTSTTTAPDEAVTYAMAAKALRCSRRTIERMAEDGRLERTPAQLRSVTRRSLVHALEQRGLVRTPDAHPAGAPVAADAQLVTALIEAQQAALKAVEESARLGERLRLLEAAEADHVRVIDERTQLLEQLLHGSRKQRRTARRLALKSNPT
jgi:hypothetical protein